MPAHGCACFHTHMGYKSGDWLWLISSLLYVSRSQSFIPKEYRLVSVIGAVQILLVIIILWKQLRGRNTEGMKCYCGFWTGNHIYHEAGAVPVTAETWTPPIFASVFAVGKKKRIKVLFIRRPLWREQFTPRPENSHSIFLLRTISTTIATLTRTHSLRRFLLHTRILRLLYTQGIM